VESGEWAGPPLTFKLPASNGYASITGTIATPWRVVMVGKDLNTLVNSTILPNLCPPPDPKLLPQGIHTSWIKPGRAVWRYLDDGLQGVEGMKEFSRMASELGFDHSILQEFWSKWTTERRKEVVAYSRKLGVSIWFWKHSKELRTPEAREEFFKMLHDFGVAGAKIDFFDHEARELIDLYEALLQKAAEYHVMVVFHGANKPTSRARTWPNEMVREAVRGMESSALKDRAWHETTLPITRCLAGPADYTAMMFNERRRNTTAAHQIASMAIFSAPLLHDCRSRNHSEKPRGRRHQERSSGLGRDHRFAGFRDRGTCSLCSAKREYLVPGDNECKNTARADVISHRRRVIKPRRFATILPMMPAWKWRIPFASEPTLSTSACEKVVDCSLAFPHPSELVAISLRSVVGEVP